MNYKLIETDIKGDERGRLIAFEEGVNCPFDVKRAFYIFDTKGGTARGCHANRNSEFLLIAINGSCKVKIDDGKTQEIVELSNPHTALYLDKCFGKKCMIFHTTEFYLFLQAQNMITLNTSEIMTNF